MHGKAKAEKSVLRTGEMTCREMPLATPSLAPEIARSAAPRFAPDRFAGSVARVLCRNRFTGLLAMRTRDAYTSARSVRSAGLGEYNHEKDNCHLLCNGHDGGELYY